MLWLGFAVLALVALGFLLWPLMRVQHGAADRRAHDIAVYRSQLAEIDQELARGALSEAEAESARLEIRRQRRCQCRCQCRRFADIFPAFRAVRQHGRPGSGAAAGRRSLRDAGPA
jgi:cytochrome c-type biogenesis protein CcmH/NrfG